MSSDPKNSNIAQMIRDAHGSNSHVYISIQNKDLICTMFEKPEKPLKGDMFDLKQNLKYWQVLYLIQVWGFTEDDFQFTDDLEDPDWDYLSEIYPDMHWYSTGDEQPLYRFAWVPKPYRPPMKASPATYTDSVFYSPKWESAKKDKN